MYYSIYFLDEFVGHHLITIGFFIVLSEICILHTIRMQKCSKLENYSELLLRNKEPMWNYILGIGLGIGTAFPYLEGQCAFIFLILNPILCGIIFIQSRRSKIKTKDNGLLVMIIIMTISFAVTVIIWSAFTGIKPAYPYFFQNSELGIF